MAQEIASAAAGQTGADLAARVAHPQDVTEVDAEYGYSEEEPGESIPWARIVLLILVVVVAGWLAIRTFFQREDEMPASAGPASSVAAGAAAAAEGAPRSELARLMAEAESGEADVPEPGAGDAGAAPAIAAREPEPEIAPGQPGVEVGVQQQQAGAEPATAAAGPGPRAAQPAPRVLAHAAIVRSSPSGATVLVDERNRGTTPLLLADLAPGRHRIVLQLRGHEDHVRQIHVPELLPSAPYELRLAPRTVRVTSAPTGATVWHGSQILAQTPCVLTDLGAGEHVLTVAAPGYETQQKTVAVNEIRGEVVHADLISLQGTLAITTVPPGCRVFVDGVYKATTVKDEDQPRTSLPLELAGFPEGEHAVRIEHPYGTERRGKMKVVRGKTSEGVIKLWVIDTKVVLADGSVKYGMLIEQNEGGDVVLAESKKQKNWGRYGKPQLVELVSLDAAEARAAMKRSRSGAKTTEPDHAARNGQE